MKATLSSEKLISRARKVLDIESAAVAALGARIGEPFIAACRLIDACTGRVVVTGMGKSGHIGDKIAATFASTGTPAFFLHAAEASHGDIGMITPQDVVLALSNSGETPELVSILPVIKLCANPRTVRTMSEHIDVDVSGLLRKELTPDQAGDKLLECMFRTANGRLTAAEALGHREFVLTRLYESA